MTRDVPANYRIGRILRLASQLIGDQISFERYRREYLNVTYEIGLTGFRLHGGEKTLYFIDVGRIVNDYELTEDARVYVHKAFWRARDYALAILHDGDHE